MSKHGLGSLADLATILEEAANPASELREDREKPKPKAATARKAPAGKQKRVIDPKRKAWYERRVKEQAESALPTDAAEAAAPPDTGKTPAITKAAATRLTGTLLATLAEAKDKKAKPETPKGRPEAWKRKPGDPIF